MTIRTLRLGAAALATVALAACNKSEPQKVDSTAAANATQTVTTPTDSAAKVDTTAPKTMIDSAKPTVDSAKPAPAPEKK